MNLRVRSIPHTPMSNIHDDQRPIAKHANNEDDSKQYRHNVRFQSISIWCVFTIRRIFVGERDVGESVHACALEKKNLFWRRLWEILSIKIILKLNKLIIYIISL